MHAMFPMGPGLEPVRQQLELVRSGEAELPPGCEITYETEAIDLLARLFEERIPVRDQAKIFYRTFKEEHGERPQASETYQAGYNPRTLGQGNGGWLNFVAAMGDMSNLHLVLLAQRAGRFLTLLDSTSMTKSYKMLLLRALLRRDALPGEMAIDALTEAFAAEASRNQYLRGDVSVDIADRRKLKRLIIDQPIEAWTGAQGSANETFFEFEDGAFRCNLAIPDDQRDAFAELVGEMIEWRLAAYLDRAAVVIELSAN